MDLYNNKSVHQKVLAYLKNNHKKGKFSIRQYFANNLGLSLHEIRHILQQYSFIDIIIRVVEASDYLENERLRSKLRDPLISKEEKELIMEKLKNIRKEEVLDISVKNIKQLQQTVHQLNIDLKNEISIDYEQKKLLFNIKESKIEFDKYQINIPSNTDEFAICSAFINHPRRKYTADKILQKVLGENTGAISDEKGKKKINDAIRRVNNKFREQTGISKFIFKKDYSYFLNPIFIKKAKK